MFSLVLPGHLSRVAPVTMRYGIEIHRRTTATKQTFHKTKKKKKEKHLSKHVLST